jgi:hypothetical protein
MALPQEEQPSIVALPQEEQLTFMALPQEELTFIDKGFRQWRDIDYHKPFALTLWPATFRLICALAAHHSFDFLRDNRDEWLAAASRELASHFKNGTSETVSEMPHGGRVAIPSKWVFQTKLLADDTVDKLKTRIVAKSFRQQRNIEHHESFAPTLRPTSFRLICALAAQHYFAFHQIEVFTVFLIPALEEEIYMRLPEQGLVSLHLPAFDSKTPIVRLRKTLFGLAQSSAKFFKHSSKILKKTSFVQSKHDPCLWIKIEIGNTKAFIGIWVDDCATTALLEDIEASKGHLKTLFDITDSGPISWFPSIIKVKDDTQHGGTVTLDQQPTKLQTLTTTTTLSTRETELNALTEAAKKAIWVRYLVAEMQTTTNDDPVEIYEDNQAAIKYLFVREQVANGAIKVTYCPTNEMIADIFAKPLTRILSRVFCLRDPAPAPWTGEDLRTQVTTLSAAAEEES